MPEYRSVSVWIMSHWEHKQHPEFPHPDTSQFQYPGSPIVHNTGAGSDESDMHISTPSKADRILGRNPSISVYVPSLPGARFFVKYSIAPPHPDGQLFFFKLFMNGRHLNSWGVNPRTKPVGQVDRAIFRTDTKWDFKDKKGGILKHKGSEARAFHFVDRGEGKSAKAADDGGLIEILVFRAKGKRRRSPYLEAFRSQDQYGISLPSSGPLERPKEARYYEWLLVDPKDKPYATFRFHYRSWDNLESLQLIPAGFPRTLVVVKKSSTIFALQSTAEELEADDEDADESADEYDEDTSSLLDTSNPSLTTAISGPKAPTIFDQVIDRSQSPPEGQASSSDSSSPSEQIRKRLRLPISSFSVHQGHLDDWEMPRPLPELPARKPSLAHSRKSSASSLTPSITPSLLPWVDGDSDDSSPEAFIGTATLVSVPQMSVTTVEVSSEQLALILSEGTQTSPLNYATETRAPTPNPFRAVPPPEASFPRPDASSAEDARQYQTDAMANDDKSEVGEESFHVVGNIEDPFYTPKPALTEGEWLRGEKASPIKQSPDQVQRKLPLRNAFESWGI